MLYAYLSKACRTTNLRPTRPSVYDGVYVCYGLPCFGKRGSVGVRTRLKDAHSRPEQVGFFVISSVQQREKPYTAYEDHTDS